MSGGTMVAAAGAFWPEAVAQVDTGATGGGASLGELQRAVLRAPASRDARFELAEAYADASSVHAAGAAAALALAPADPDAHFNLGLALDALGPAHTATAVEAYAAAVRLDPTATDALINLGLARKAAGDVAGAAAAHRAAFALSEELGVLWATRLLGEEEGGAVGRAAVATGPTALAGRWGVELADLSAALRAAGYCGAAASAALGWDAAEGWRTGTEYFLARGVPEVLARLDAASGPVPMLVRLLLLGCATSRAAAVGALGLPTLVLLERCGLIAEATWLAAPGWVVGAVQLYPLDPVEVHAGCGGAGPLLMATDWPVDTLLPGETSVMAIGVDSLELVHP